METAAAAATAMLVACMAAWATAQTAGPAAASPAVPAVVGLNVTAVLEQAGCNVFINMLRSTQTLNQIQIQLATDSQGMTILAPTDAAFSALKPGTLNSLTDQQKAELLQYHVLPQYYSQGQLQSASNPVRTSATGNSGPFGINVTSSGATNSAINITTGVDSTSLSSPVYAKPPLAVYQMDKVLLPNEIFGAKPPASAPVPEAGAPLAIGVPSASPSSAKDSTDTSSATAVSASRFGFLFNFFFLFLAVTAQAFL